MPFHTCITHTFSPHTTPSLHASPPHTFTLLDMAAHLCTLPTPGYTHTHHTHTSDWVTFPTQLLPQPMQFGFVPWTSFTHLGCILTCIFPHAAFCRAYFSPGLLHGFAFTGVTHTGSETLRFPFPTPTFTSLHLSTTLGYTFTFHYIPHDLTVLPYPSLALLRCLP